MLCAPSKPMNPGGGLATLLTLRGRSSYNTQREVWKYEIWDAWMCFILLWETSRSTVGNVISNHNMLNSKMSIWAKTWPIRTWEMSIWTKNCRYEQEKWLFEREKCPFQHSNWIKKCLNVKHLLFYPKHVQFNRENSYSNQNKFNLNVKKDTFASYHWSPHINL